MTSRLASPGSALRVRGAVRVLCGLLVTAAACGDGGAERERARAALEEEFGPRGGPTAEEASGRAVSPGGGTTGEALPADPEVQAQAGTRAPRGAEARPPAEPAPDPEAEGGAAVPPPDSVGPPRRSSDSGTVESSEAGQLGTPAPAGVDVDSLLVAAERAYGALGSLRASFVQRTEVPLLERTAEGRGTWYQRGRDRFRMDFVEPPEDIFVADGTHLWLYQPSQQPDQVIKSPLAAGTVETGTADLLGRLLSEARSSYDGAHEGMEPVDGVVTHHLALTPRPGADFRAVDVWIGASDALVRRFRIEEENETLRTVTLSRLEPDIPLPDSLFRFEPPPGATVFER